MQGLPLRVDQMKTDGGEVTSVQDKAEPSRLVYRVHPYDGIDVCTGVMRFSRVRHPLK